MIKRIMLTLAMVMSMSAVSAKPIFVGHRGSLYGLENSVESFTNGAKMGYQYLETDIKVTKDLQFVCTHDDDLTRLGGTLSIASSTLEQLQAEPLSQTRGGVAYTGRLCSAKEYLDVCRQYNVRPLIELKWATGINSNDCSNIPLLIKFIEEQGFRDKCIILTSMKPCLEYIRKNYPDITLQFLTGQYWANHFDWCVAQGIDVDIQAGYFDKSTVEKFHEAGLKVNMWTLNSDADYVKYGNWGCDFVTTDYLDPKTVPELDPLASIVPNKVDYPVNKLLPRGNYKPQSGGPYPTPDVINGTTMRMAAMHGYMWSVLVEKDGGVAIYDFDYYGLKLKERKMPVDVAVKSIAYTADGYLLAVSEVKAASTGVNPLTVYTWDDAEAQPRVLAEITAPGQAVAAGDVELNERFAVSGNRDDIRMYLPARIEDAATLTFCVVYIKDGKMTKSFVAATDIAAAALADCRVVVTPTSRDHLMVISDKERLCREYAFDRETGEMKAYTEFDPTAAVGRCFFRRGSKPYMASLDDSGKMSFAAYYAAKAEPLDEVVSIATGITPEVETFVGAEEGLYGIRVHVLTADGRLASVQMHDEIIHEPAENADFVAERVWERSVAANNAPTEIIDGTNAQQGTAVYGKFYINDKSTKTLNIFDTKGNLTTLLGGAGYGCCRDDRGNVIVRNDLSTGTTHEFLIYRLTESGVNDYTVESEPVSVTCEVPIAGQTNFISASGDVFGDDGHIYLYPNKAAAVNIICMSRGKVVKCVSKDGLAMTGTTAGYVYPIEDDSENWLYQVRGTGIYRYCGGDNIAVSTTRAGTTAPARNSTTGFAYFVYRGHEFLVHNSGKNYLGGLTIRNLTTDKVIASFDPLGNKGYTEGGNYSVSNWIIPEIGGFINGYCVNIYQYCPANGLAIVRLYDKNQGVEDIAVDTAVPTLKVVQEGDVLYVIGAERFTVYSLDGITRRRAVAGNTDVSGLARGIYVVAAEDGRTAKIAIR